MALPVVELLQGATDEEVNLLGLRLVHILCRDELSFHEVLRAGGVALILSKLDAPESIASVAIARAAMLAIGNITFQVCQSPRCLHVLLNAEKINSVCCVLSFLQRMPLVSRCE